MDLTINSRILERKKVALETTEVAFYRPKDFNFEAGQYARVIIPELLHEDPRGNSRLFSIASSPNNKERLIIAFRDSGSGYKRTLLNCSFSHGISITGPFGKDFLLPASSGNIVFVAGGIGVTPFLCMAGFATEQKLNLNMTLLYGNLSKERAAYTAELDDLSHKNAKFVIKNRFGPLDQEFLKDAVSNPKEVFWYVAGPKGMVENTLTLLAGLGVAQSSIKKESFTGY